MRRAEELRWDAHIRHVFDDICSHIGMPQLRCRRSDNRVGSGATATASQQPDRWALRNLPDRRRATRWCRRQSRVHAAAGDQLGPDRLRPGPCSACNQPGRPPPRGPRRGDRRRCAGALLSVGCAGPPLRPLVRHAARVPAAGCPARQDAQPGGGRPARHGRPARAARLSGPEDPDPVPGPPLGAVPRAVGLPLDPRVHPGLLRRPLRARHPGRAQALRLGDDRGGRIRGRTAPVAAAHDRDGGRVGAVGGDAPAGALRRVLPVADPRCAGTSSRGILGAARLLLGRRVPDDVRHLLLRAEAGRSRRSRAG